MIVKVLSATFATLSQYPQSEAFSGTIRSHRASEKTIKDNRTSLFYSTWFLDGRPNVAMQCSIDHQGKMTTQRDVYNWAIQASHSQNLKPAQISSLRTALRQLPPSSKKPTMKDLLIVSYRDRSHWKSRIYDKSNPPAAVARIYKITGAPLK